MSVSREEGQENAHSSLATGAARQLATTTKSQPQMQGITPRWLLQALDWVNVSGGVYRVNRRLSYAVGDGRLSFSNVGVRVEVVPQELSELPLLRGFTEDAELKALASHFVQCEFRPGQMLVERGAPSEHIFLLAHGRAAKLGVGQYGEEIVLDTLSDGDHWGDQAVIESDDFWGFGVRALTPCTVLMLSQEVFTALIEKSAVLKAHVEQYKVKLRAPQDKLGQAAIALAAGHSGEQVLPGTFVDYDMAPREYELSVAQAVLRVHSRVSDLFNEPMNQVDEQLRLSIEALQERQEHELINNREFGLLHNADLKQRLHARHGVPTPDDLDELLSRRRRSKFFLAHPRAIEAFHRECSRKRIMPSTIEFMGSRVSAWRGVPLLPCDKLPISKENTTSILVMRTGEAQQGVIGLHRTGLPEEIRSGISARKMGVDDKAVTSFLISTYFSAAVLVPDALGMLENIELRR